MTASAGENSSREPEQRAAGPPGADGLEELRGLIVGPEQRQLQELRHRLDEGE